MTVPVAKPIAVWLFICASMVVAMMIIGAMRKKEEKPEPFLKELVSEIRFILKF